MKPNLFRLGTVFAIFFLAALCPMLVLAHNELLKTEPAAGAALKTAPAHVELWLSEKPDLTISKIAVKGPSGPVEMGPIHSLPDKSLIADFKGKLSNGQYVVNWQTAGDDGHVSKGQFSFTVKSGL